MIQLGVNSVLFKAYSFAEAARAIALAGYDGVEISMIQGMCEHLDPHSYNRGELNAIMEANNLKWLSAEVASLDCDRLKACFEACADVGIPIVNVGPGGKSDDEADFLKSTETLQARAELAKTYGLTLCCKAHVGSAIYNTPTTLQAMGLVTSDAFGVDMDPSHIHRAGENPAEALPSIISRVRHVHIRDCKGPGPGPGAPALQACGRGDIDLGGYFKAMTEANYNGPVCLEVIGPDQTMTQAAVIAAESYGYMNALLKSLGGR